MWDDVIYAHAEHESGARSGGRITSARCRWFIVERTIDLYSNPSDVVLEPFMGIGTVPYVAIQRGGGRWASS